MGWPQHEPQVCVDRVLRPPLARQAAEVARLMGGGADPALLPDMLAAGLPHPEAAVMVTGKRWTSGQTISISFLSGSEALRARVRKYATRWLWDANLRFRWLGLGDAGTIRIDFRQGQGSWSYLGTDAVVVNKSEPTMNYGWIDENSPEEEVRRVVLHEFGHALALGHEHSHPEGGIPWDKEAAYAYYARQGWSREEVDYQVFKRYAVTQTNFSRYDPKSIMHYPISADLLTDASRAVGWNTYRSATDRAFVRRAYPRDAASMKRMAREAYMLAAAAWRRD